MTGNIGRPGTGANSITGQCNAMGSRLFSNTTNLLGGHDFANAEHRQKVADVLEHRRMPRFRSRSSWPYHQIIEGILERRDPRPVGHRAPTRPIRGSIRATAATFSTGSTFSSCRTCTTRPRRRSSPTSCCRPPAGARRKARSSTPNGASACIKKVARAPGAGARRLFDLQADRRSTGAAARCFAQWNSPEAVFQILKQLSAGQPCDITGIDDYRMLDERGGIQWPYPARRWEPDSERRLVRRRPLLSPRTAARASSSSDPRPLPEAPDAQVSFLLLTGRGSAAQWHTQTRTGKVGRAAQALPGASCTSRSIRAMPPS